MSREKLLFWLGVVVLLGFGILVGQLVAVSVAAAAGAVLAYLAMNPRAVEDGRPELRSELRTELRTPDLRGTAGGPAGPVA